MSVMSARSHRVPRAVADVPPTATAQSNSKLHATPSDRTRAGRTAPARIRRLERSTQDSFLAPGATSRAEDPGPDAGDCDTPPPRATIGHLSNHGAMSATALVVTAGVALATASREPRRVVRWVNVTVFSS